MDYIGKKGAYKFNATLESVCIANSITLQAYLSLQEITVLNQNPTENCTLFTVVIK